MAIKVEVIESTGSSEKTTSKIDFLEEIDAPIKVKDKIKRDVGKYLVAAIIDYAASQKSPVSGMGWPALSKEYKKKKSGLGAGTAANLRLNDDLLPALKFKSTEDGLEIGWWGKQSAKADGHANLSGKSNIPTRRAIPDMGQTFKKDILADIEQIIDSRLEESDG